MALLLVIPFRRPGPPPSMRIVRSGIGEFIGRSVADAENIYLSYLGCLRCHSQGAIEIYLASNGY